MNGRWWPRKRTPPAEHSISPPSQPRSATVMAAILGDNRIYWPGVWSRPEFVSSRPSTVPESLGTPTRTISISSATALSRRCSRRSSRLLDDLADRGLLDSTLVIWMGDFGRSPKINRDAGQGSLAAVLFDGACRRRDPRRTGDRRVRQDRRFSRVATNYARRRTCHGLCRPRLRSARNDLPHLGRPSPCARRWPADFRAIVAPSPVFLDDGSGSE